MNETELAMAEMSCRAYELAIARLTGGRPGYHTLTVKELLTAIGDAREELE